MTGRLQLRDDVAVEVAYRDRNLAGSPVTRGPAVRAREVFAPLIAHLEAHGWDTLVEASPALLDQVVRSEVFAEIAEVQGRSWQLRAEVLFPDPELAPPAGLAVRRRRDTGTDDLIEAPVPLPDWPDLHQLFASMASADGLDPATVPPRFAAFVAALAEQGFAGPPLPPDPGVDPYGTEDLTFVGHNTVVVRGDTGRIITDPYLLPADPALDDPLGYRPVPLRLLGALDAVLLTHSHPDHFDPASLLRIGRHVPVVVPVVERETILAVDLARRLGELGCTDVRPLRWGDTVTFGDLTVTALPFFGEQPGDGTVLHPEVTNAGNTYLVDGPRGRVAFLADSGRDHRGDVVQVAASTGAVAPVDLVFSGYRAWDAYPAELLLSSVAHYLYFVPPSEWTRRQRLMNGPDDAVRAAVAFGARVLVPYADGGAPWYWRRGLGPVLDGSAQERPGFDPFPERVEEAARATGSAVEVRLLRPGDGLRLALGVHDGTPDVVRHPGYAWPY